MLRIKNGDTQESIAEKIKVPKRTYASWERGERAIPYDSLTVIADMYNVSIDYLLGREDQEVAPAKEPAVIDNGAAALDIAELQNLAVLIKTAINQQKNYMQEDKSASSIQRQIMALDENRIKLHERLLAMDDKQLDKVEAIISLVEQMSDK